MVLGQKLSLTLVAATLLISVPALSYAESLTSFVKSMDGKYSARGTAEIVEGKPDKVSCKLTNSFDSDKNQLSMSGKCASVRGKGRIKGTLKIVGEKVSGGFTQGSDEIEIVKSSGSFSNNQIILLSNVVDKRSGKHSKVRQVISKSGNGFKTVFSLFDNKTSQYNETGSLILK